MARWPQLSYRGLPQNEAPLSRFFFAVRTINRAPQLGQVGASAESTSSRAVICRSAATRRRRSTTSRGASNAAFRAQLAFQASALTESGSTD